MKSRVLERPGFRGDKKPTHSVGFSFVMGMPRNNECLPVYTLVRNRPRAEIRIGEHDRLLFVIKQTPMLQTSIMVV